MIFCSGVVCISGDSEVKFTETKSGYFADFIGVQQNKGINGKKETHKYRFNVWVAKDEAEKWEKKLVAGAVIEFNGHWSAVENPEYKYPLNTIKTTCKAIRCMKVAHWYEDVEGDET